MRQWAPAGQPTSGLCLAIIRAWHSGMSFTRGNPRKLWFALLPAQTLLTNSAPFLVFSRGDVTTQAFVLGMLNSSVADWYGHLRLVLHLNYFILDTVPIPPFDPEDERATRAASLAATLATSAEGDFGEWRTHVLPDGRGNRADMFAEIDGIASVLYGLGRAPGTRVG